MSNNGLSSPAQPSSGEGAAGPRKRKIDRSEWPTLLARRQAGATQAQIAHDYGVSQGTVSQILKRARADAEGQPVADLDADTASDVDEAEDGGSPEPAAPAAQGGAAASTHVGAPANDPAVPRRTLTTRARPAPDTATNPGAGATTLAPQDTRAETPASADGDAGAAGETQTPGAGTPDAGHRSGNALADRLREATERCAGLVDEKATSDTLSSAVHEVRRALAAIEIDAAKQNSPAAQRPRQAPASRLSQSANATAQQPPRPPEPFEPPRRDPGIDTGKAAGRVKFFKPEKGFGFIIPDDGGDDIFVGKDTVQAAGIDRLSEGDRVRYTPGPGAKGLEAKTIERIG